MLKLNSAIEKFKLLNYFSLLHINKGKHEDQPL